MELGVAVALGLGGSGLVSSLICISGFGALGFFLTSLEETPRLVALLPSRTMLPLDESFAGAGVVLEGFRKRK